MTSSSAAASRTVRATGADVPRPSEPEPYGDGDTRPRDGLIPRRPQHDAGMRIEPPPSLPCATGHSPAAVAAAAPPLDPPGVRDVSHGLRHTPFSSDSVIAIVRRPAVSFRSLIEIGTPWNGASGDTDSAARAAASAPSVSTVT